MVNVPSIIQDTRAQIAGHRIHCPLHTPDIAKCLVYYLVKLRILGPRFRDPVVIVHSRPDIVECLVHHLGKLRILGPRTRDAGCMGDQVSKGDLMSSTISISVCFRETAS